VVSLEAKLINLVINFENGYKAPTGSTRLHPVMTHPRKKVSYSDKYL